MINACFKLLGFEVICYAAIDKVCAYFLFVFLKTSKIEPQDMWLYAEMYTLMKFGIGTHH